MATIGGDVRMLLANGIKGCGVSMENAAGLPCEIRLDVNTSGSVPKKL
jgi:hypothetical protein